MKFGLVMLWICLLCLPALLVVAIMVWRKMGTSVGASATEDWKLIHKTQDMRAERIEHNTNEILRKVGNIEESSRPNAAGDGQNESGATGTSDAGRP